LDTLNNHIFDFLLEISKNNTYRLLCPDPKAGLAIIWLYGKIEKGVFENKAFKEKDIHEALQAVNTLDQGVERHLKEHYNSIVADLQEYFLRYDDERQEYTFKEHAFRFCRQNYDTLKAFFDPTQIEKICYVLKEKLQSRSNETELLDWFKTELQTFNPLLKSQLDSLDRQIDKSVADLRGNKKLNLQEGAIIETLRQIDARFELIRDQNKELRIAFREIDEIRRLMNGYAEKYDNEAIHNLTHNAILFFQEMRRTLSVIDKRLDRIQPKVKQLFSNLNKPLFNSRVEKFLFFLVENAQKDQKTISLPAGIPPLFIDKTPLDFTIVERKNDLFPVKPQKRIMIPETPETKAMAFAAAREKLIRHDEISKWLALIQKDVDEKRQVRFSDYFFKILDTNGENALALAVSVAFRTILFFDRHPGYSLSIHPEELMKQENKKTTIWEMNIARK
jgi:hypothetical protein